MPNDPIPVDDLKEPGQYQLYAVEPFADVFICRIRYEGGMPPPGAVKVDATVSDKHCLVAFSRLCTHLGCHVAANTKHGSPTGKLPALPGEATFVSSVVCPCHFSNFDLAASGLTTIGPATDCLPQVWLESAEPGQVNLVRWMRDPRVSVPYGVPFQGTTNKPPEKP